MQFFTTDLNGITLVNPDPVARREVLRSVAGQESADFPEVYLSVDKGPVLGYRAGGILVWEEGGEVRRLLREVDVATATNIWDRAINDPSDAMPDLDWVELPVED